MQNQTLSGSLVALVTPMQPNGALDMASLRRLLDWHLAANTDGIVVAGTTGEAAALTDAEHYELIADVVEQVAGRIPVIAGTGTQNLARTLELTRQAKKAGAQAALIVTPYYVKPTQHGLQQYYQTIAEKIDFPFILYNVPGRTGCDLLPDTVAKLSTIKQIIGLKEAVADQERLLTLRQCTPNEFGIYSGDDATALDAMLAGANGVISVTANVAPEQMHALCAAAHAKQTEKARQLQKTLMPLHHALFLESNPIPTKWALAQMGLIPSGIRLPLTPFDQRFHAELISAMQAAGVL